MKSPIGLSSSRSTRACSIAAWRIREGGQPLVDEGCCFLGEPLTGGFPRSGFDLKPSTKAGFSRSPVFTARKTTKGSPLRLAYLKFDRARPSGRRHRVKEHRTRIAGPCERGYMGQDRADAGACPLQQACKMPVR